jgi:hypothetical protein
MIPPNHCASALRKIQRIVTLASTDEAPITSREAYEQIIEELELAGFGSMVLDPTLADAAPQPARRRGH